MMIIFVLYVNLNVNLNDSVNVHETSVFFNANVLSLMASFEVDSSLDQDVSLSKASVVSASVSDIDLGSSNVPVISMLERLKSPEPSELSCKRRVISNKPPVGLK